MPLLRPRLLHDSYLYTNHIHEEYAHSLRRHASNLKNAVDKSHFWPPSVLQKKDAGKLLKRCGRTQDQKEMENKGPIERAKDPNTADTSLMLRTYAFERE